MDRQYAEISAQALESLRKQAWLAGDWAKYTRAAKELNRRLGKDFFDENGGWGVVDSWADPQVVDL